jgi:hypothetical protein
VPCDRAAPTRAAATSTDRTRERGRTKGQGGKEIDAGRRHGHVSVWVRARSDAATGGGVCAFEIVYMCRRRGARPLADGEWPAALQASRGHAR